MKNGQNLKQIKVAIQSDLKERYVGDTAKLLQEAAFLDPRFKQLDYIDLLSLQVPSRIYPMVDISVATKVLKRMK